MLICQFAYPLTRPALRPGTTGLRRFTGCNGNHPGDEPRPTWPRSAAASFAGCEPQSTGMPRPTAARRVPASRRCPLGRFVEGVRQRVEGGSVDGVRVQGVELVENFHFSVPVVSLGPVCRPAWNCPSVECPPVHRDRGRYRVGKSEGGRQKILMQRGAGHSRASRTRKRYRPSATGSHIGLTE